MPGIAARSWRKVALCAGINILDGFDVMAMAYVAPALAREWRLSPAEVGLLLSAGLAGMVLGSVLLGPAADRFGRRPVILSCLGVAAASMATAMLATGLSALIAVRVVTGIAIGGLLPTLNTIVAELSEGRQRGLSVGLMQSGFAVGASLGGFAAVALLSASGWRGVFGAGALAALPLLAWAWHDLEESLPRPADKAAREAVGLRASLLGLAWWLLLGAFACSMISLFFLLSWTPKVLVDAGLSEPMAVLAGAMLTAGGVIAALGVGWVAMRGPIAPALALLSLCSALGTAAFGTFDLTASAALAAAFALGLVTNATQIGLYVLCPTLFPPCIRAGATGLAVGLGRSGAATGPALAGWLLSLGASRPQLFLIMAVPYALAAAFIASLQSYARH